ncbi:phosphomannomutase/phosphoglucomutase [Chelativorans sp. M5D2P16]|uniref:phosphomannomutase/phosphoglucomutase n=1 Tax=Chelativorans sp. M5D2P16 TaxID=3095678 RepID=UPI002ACA9BA7|nr:phosphomannomutase/phosphoglucomutase [Chelativorans sp. M5D2P16]MDZ5698417.1 phosphomannomutase/phosphoglucomutase [Chelativorans sp. M5D2P16]
MSAPFKAYDVRGQIPGEINVPFAYRFGQAVKESLGSKAVVVGHDMRLDSPALAGALAQGLLDSGVNVLPVGQCGTEEVYFHTARSGADAGLMVTASHNPPDYNGIKMVLKGAAAATPDNAFNAIEALMRSDRRFATAADYAGRGALQPTCDRTAYIERLLEEVAGQNLKPLKIVCHAGNGCAGPIIDLLEEHLPFTFIKIDHEPDPRLPNGVPNPLLKEKRQKASQAVVEHGADLAIAWDGDFDRCFLYDHKGRFVEGYYLVGMIAKRMLEKVPGSTILYDPRLTWNTIDIVESMGGVAKPCRTGHAYFKHMMREENAIYGGEMSAHHYFRDFAYCDSGMLAWLDVVCELSATGAQLADVLEERIAKFPCSGEINFTVEDAKAIQEKIAEHYKPANPEVETLDGLGLVFDDWRFNLRASNTEPLLRLNVETRADRQLLEEKVAELRGLIGGTPA